MPPAVRDRGLPGCLSFSSGMTCADQLQPLLTDFVAPDAGGAIYVQRPEAAFQPRRVRALADFLADHFSAIEASNLRAG